MTQCALKKGRFIATSQRRDNSVPAGTARAQRKFWKLQPTLRRIKQIEEGSAGEEPRGRWGRPVIDGSWRRPLANHRNRGD